MNEIQAKKKQEKKNAHKLGKETKQKKSYGNNKHEQNTNGKQSKRNETEM